MLLTISARQDTPRVARPGQHVAGLAEPSAPGAHAFVVVWAKASAHVNPDVVPESVDWVGTGMPHA